MMTPRKNDKVKVEMMDRKMIITIDLEDPTPSASGKTIVIASSRGNVETDCTILDKPIIVGVNAYIAK